MVAIANPIFTVLKINNHKFGGTELWVGEFFVANGCGVEFGSFFFLQNIKILVKCPFEIFFGL